MLTLQADRRCLFGRTGVQQFGSNSSDRSTLYRSLTGECPQLACLPSQGESEELSDPTQPGAHYVR
eukprot:3940700-Rhodomonas_salina.5